MSGCAATPSAGHDPRAGYFADPADFIGVNFKAGQPSSDNDLIASLADDRSNDALRHDLGLIAKFPATEPLRVEGYTDSHECSGSSCVALSQRRAQAVHDWLIQQGVPSSRLSSPFGYGAARPIGDNGTDAGRASNRRAYISYTWR
ncbi:OmpA family protein [Pseudoxanthomonas sacheonensis]|uniref:OmpA family protein n=1 Tax=Pseudoxanthomonas sacheonensis TaxID=443615 RepID=UPI003D2F5AFD